jgi:hypothetical protein
MFDVETSTSHGITVRDHEDGHIWVFVVDNEEPARTLSVSAVVTNPSAGNSPYDHAGQAQTFAEMEAWKRGLID